MDDNFTIPPSATLPEPLPQTDEEKRLATIATAHVYVEQLRQDAQPTGPRSSNWIRS